MKIVRFWFPVLIYSAIIFYVSGIPNLHPPVEVNNIDKILHIGEYLILGILLVRAVVNSVAGEINCKLIVFTMLLACFYALSDEYHQSFVVGREASIGDFLADVLGVIFGIYIYIIKVRRKLNVRNQTI